MFVVLPGLVYILASWIAFKSTDDTSWLVYCSVGYSGAITLDAEFDGRCVSFSHSKSKQHSLFFFFKIAGCLFSLVVLETRLGDHLQPRRCVLCAHVSL